MALSLCLAGSPAVAPASSDQVSAEAPAEYELSWKSLHMGTFISGRVFAADPEKTRELAKLAESEIVRYESALSVHEDTPLARVNAQSGSFVEVDAETAEARRGSRVRVVRGPFAGLEGRLVRYRNRSYVVLTVTSLGVLVHVPKWYCRAAE